LPRENPASIYNHLFALLDAVLSSHRLKLAGRTHLLNVALCSLLRPLFVPVLTNKTYASSQPAWLRRRAAKVANPIGKSQAQLFARLLTTLADPSASAVARSSKNRLVSATAKAKRNAGQHLGVVLAAYVKWTLDLGLKMEGGVREGLREGWWAVLESMGADGRRTLGEEMDRPGREILRGMVEEWSRFGRWRGN
jgi:hypothetical protein